MRLWGSPKPVQHALPHGDAERLLVAALAAAALLPRGIFEHGARLCLISRAIGRPCPACGLSRSWAATADLDLRRAFAMHPLGPITFGLAVALVARKRIRLLLARRGARARDARGRMPA